MALVFILKILKSPPRAGFFLLRRGAICSRAPAGLLIRPALFRRLAQSPCHLPAIQLALIEHFSHPPRGILSCSKAAYPHRLALRRLCPSQTNLFSSLSEISKTSTYRLRRPRRDDWSCGPVPQAVLGGWPCG